MLHGPPTSHFLFAKHVLPALKQAPASSFLFVSEGAGASPCCCRWDLHLQAAGLLALRWCCLWAQVRAGAVVAGAGARQAACTLHPGRQLHFNACFHPQSTAGKRMVHPDSSLYSVAASALYGIILAAQEQYGEAPFRVNEIRL